MSGNLLIAETTSDAGKTVVVGGFCRWLARRGVSVAPFKAQNMSLNSFVTHAGEEIGRAQAVQAFAAGIEPEAAMNPILLKPGSDRRSQVVVMGKPVGERNAVTYWRDQASLLDVVVSAYQSVRRRFDVVVCEGGGSPAEINLRGTDIANMESSAGVVDGLDMLPVRTRFGQDKVLGRPRRELHDGCVVEGYEIHHGVVTLEGGEPFFADEGCRIGSVAGTVWHGLFENDAFRRRYLADVAAQTDRAFVPAAGTCFAAVREERLNALGDLIAEHLDCDQVWSLITDGPRSGQPVLSLRSSV